MIPIPPPILRFLLAGVALVLTAAVGVDAARRPDPSRSSSSRWSPASTAAARSLRGSFAACSGTSASGRSCGCCTTTRRRRATARRRLRSRRSASSAITSRCAANGTGKVQRYADAIAEVAEARRAGVPVLVHCAAGARRSAAVISMYQLLVEGRARSSVVYRRARPVREAARRGLAAAAVPEREHGRARRAARRARRDRARCPSPLPLLAAAAADDSLATRVARCVRRRRAGEPAGSLASRARPELAGLAETGGARRGMTDRARLAVAGSGRPGRALRRWRLLLLGGRARGPRTVAGRPVPALARCPASRRSSRSPGQSRIHIILVATLVRGARERGALRAAARDSRGSGRGTSASRSPRTAAPRARLAPASLALLLGSPARWPARCAGRSPTAACGGTRPGPCATRSSGRRRRSDDDPTRLEFDPATWIEHALVLPQADQPRALQHRRALSPGRLALATGAPRRGVGRVRAALPGLRGRAARRCSLLGAAGARPRLPARRARGGVAARDPSLARPLRRATGAATRSWCCSPRLAAWCLLHGLRDGRWRWWLGYAAAQLGLLWVHPLAVHFPHRARRGGRPRHLARPRHGAPTARCASARFVAANALAAIVFLQVMAPNLSQSRAPRPRVGAAARHCGQLARNLWGSPRDRPAPRRMPWDPDYTVPDARTLALGRRPLGPGWSSSA